MTQTPLSAPHGAINPPPTPYDPLNAILAHLVRRARELLAENFIGAYLQGSFALGDFDEKSDVDFLIVVGRDIADADVPALNALHTAIHDFPPPWGHRLEGSYFPSTVLRCWSESPRDPPGVPPRPPTWADPGTSGSPPRVYPLLYLDHGARTLVRSEHDNTRVVRWVTREKGIVLTGPNTRDLIDEVTADALREEVGDLLRRVATSCIANPDLMALHWQQAFYVVLFCRMLYSLETGAVTSKRAAAVWARGQFDARWRPLIERAVSRKPSDAIWNDPAQASEIVETLAFIRYVAELARVPR
jgi:aminoglycoside adenylyltransferase-like protein/nucleotidyltransferase-like protein